MKGTSINWLKILELSSESYTVAEIAFQLDCSTRTVQRVISKQVDLSNWEKGKKEDPDMELICSPVETADFQCCVVEDGYRCVHGVRNFSRMYCSMHYARFQRLGTVYPIRTKLQAERRRRDQQILDIAKNGLSLTCICTHKFDGHSHRSKRSSNCLVEGCKCTKFESVNQELLNKVYSKIKKMGFVCLNDTALCLRCKEYIPIGYWHDPFVFNRIRAHLKAHAVPKSSISAYRPTG